MIGAYIAVVLGVAVWSLMTLVGRKVPDGVMRGITVFGGAFLLGVCVLGLLPEATEVSASGTLLPFLCILAGFLIQQLLEALSAHAEHGHVEVESGKRKVESGGVPVVGLMLGLCLHAFLEGMPLVEMDGAVNHGLLYGILIHNIPVALILVALLTAQRMGFWRVLALLTLFGLMSPLGSLFNLYLVQPDEEHQRMIIGLVIGVLLHVSSSILFDHKQHGFSWLNIGLCVVAFAAAFLTVH